MSKRGLDMDRNFALLGLNEDAGKEAVQAAYERRLAKYKSADYADDPEYAARKISELRQAYESAYAAAGNGGGSENYYHDSREKQAESAKLRREHDEKNHQQKRKRSWDEDGSPKKKKFNGMPKVSELKVSELKEKAKEAGAAAKEHMYRLDDSGTGNVVDAAQESSDSGTSSGKGLEGPKQFMSIVGLIVTLVVAGFTMCIDDTPTDYDDLSGSEPYHEYLNGDWNVWEKANSFDSYVTGNEAFDDSFTAKGYDVKELRKALDLFVKNYTERDSYKEEVSYLMENYDDFFVNESRVLESQAETLLDFYGFPSWESMEGYIRSDNGETITNMKDYVDYLNWFYDEYYNFER